MFCEMAQNLPLTDQIFLINLNAFSQFVIRILKTFSQRPQITHAKQTAQSQPSSIV